VDGQRIVRFNQQRTPHSMIAAVDEFDIDDIDLDFDIDSVLVGESGEHPVSVPLSLAVSRPMDKLYIGGSSKSSGVEPDAPSEAWRPTKTNPLISTCTSSCSSGSTSEEGETIEEADDVDSVFEVTAPKRQRVREADEADEADEANAGVVGAGTQVKIMEARRLQRPRILKSDFRRNYVNM
jgi:hypothetical protein